MDSKASQPNSAASRKHSAVPAPSPSAEPINLINPTYSPNNLLSLGKTLGNQSLIRLLQHSSTTQPQQIQRAFTAGRDFLLATANKTPFKQISARLDQYNTFLNKPVKDKDDYELAFYYLDRIRRRLFKWFDDSAQTHEALGDDPLYATMKDLHDQWTREHTALIGMTKNMADVSPFQQGAMPNPEFKAMDDLYRSIIGGTGKIKLMGDEAMKNVSLSQLAQLLATPTGRKLLAYLNKESDAEQLSGVQDEMTNIYIGNDKADLPGTVRTAAKKVENKTFSVAQPLEDAKGMLGGPQPILPTDDRSEFLVVQDPKDYKDAILQGKKGIIFNNKKYLFSNTSTGAMVSVFEKESTSETEEHHQVFTPGFVTLGHELGHAMHMRGGGTNLNQNPEVMEGLTGQSPDRANAIWQNTEEELTIQGIENPIREESGLPNERISHIPYTAGKATENYWNIRELIAPFLARDTAIKQTDAYKDFDRRLKGAFNNRSLKDDGVYNPLLTEARNLPTVITDGIVIAWKKKFATDEFTKLKNRWDGKSFFKISRAQRTEYNRIKAAMKDTSLNAMVGIGIPIKPLDDLVESMKKLYYELR